MHMRPIYIVLGVLLIIAGFALVREKGGPETSGIINATASMATTTLSITSPAFGQGGRIPSKYTCDGERTLSPALAFSGVPEGTKTLALIMDDPDVPKAVRPEGVFDHWALFNIPPTAAGIPEGGSLGVAGANGAGNNAYTGPCPPPQYEPSEHRYIFTLYALDAKLPLAAGVSKQDVLRAMEGHVIGKAELIGKYKRI